jgi:hypothetical protein
MGKPLPITDTEKINPYYSKQRQNRDYANSQKLNIFGIDTEARDGDIFLLADSDGRYIDEFDGITGKSVLDFLFHRKYQNSWNFFYFLTYDNDVILKLLGTTLNAYKKTGDLSFDYENYHVRVIGGTKIKQLSIKKGHKSAIFYDIAQFCQGGLVNAYEKNIQKIPDEYKKLKLKRDQFSKRFYSNNRNKIRQYCIQDCIYTKELSEHFVKTFSNAFSFYPKRWISSGYLAEKVIINNNVKIPFFNDIPFEIQQMANCCYFGQRTEIFWRGFIGKAYIYDINSAYPYALAQFPDLNDGQWVRRKSIHINARLGFFKIETNIPDLKMIPPFAFKKHGGNYFPSGKFVTFCTLEELKMCEKKSYYKILDSHQFITNSKNYPFKDFIYELYEKRLKMKNEKNPMQLPIKLILNSIYGKTGQNIKGEIGNLYNPIIFRFIQGYVRAMLYNFKNKHNLEYDTVAFATDSICTPKKLDIDSDEIGEFSLEKSGDDVYFLQNGYYRVNNIWKSRGMGKLNGKTIEHLDTFTRNGKLYMKYVENRVEHVRSCILQNRIEDIGKFKEKIKNIDLNADKKRNWGGDTLDGINRKMQKSISISLNYFEI